MPNCPHCDFSAKTAQGLAVHLTRKHADAPPIVVARPKIRKAWCGHVVGEGRGVPFTEADRGFTVELCPECAAKIE